MKPLADAVIELQNSENKVHFYPQRFENTLLQWMNNIQDWCISRQLWWGHQIPAWYKTINGKEEIYVGINPPKEEGWVRDEDALDTWFSSALWPFSTLGWPEKTEDLERFFPGDTLVTGYDIIFFWVARMIFQSKYLTNQRPFKDVLIHGIIRDELGRKVSKSLGNGVDIMECFKQYGVDSVRYFLTTTGAPGQDIRYSDEKLASTWNYINKIWNISRYIGLQFDNYDYQGEDIKQNLLSIADRWILTRLNEVITDVDKNFEKYEFGEVAKTIYNFTWDDFASWYLEMTKVDFLNATKEKAINTCAVLSHVLTSILKLLHPFIPFVTEDIYQMFHEGSITVSKWPTVIQQYQYEESKQIEIIYDIITSVRNTRALKNVPISKPIDVILQSQSQKILDFLDQNKEYLKKFIHYNNITFVTKSLDTEKSIINVLNDVKVIIPLATLVDLEEEQKKLMQEKEKMIQEVNRCEKMLQNPNFIAKAPQNKIEEEQKKLKTYQARLQEIEKLLLDE